MTQEQARAQRAVPGPPEHELEPRAAPRLAGEADLAAQRAHRVRQLGVPIEVIAQPFASPAALRTAIVSTG